MFYCRLISSKAFASIKSFYFTVKDPTIGLYEPYLLIIAMS